MGSRRVGEAAFSKVEKVNSELFSLTYGAIVTQLIKDYEGVDATNVQLEKMCAGCRARRAPAASLRGAHARSGPAAACPHAPFARPAAAGATTSACGSSTSS